MLRTADGIKLGGHCVTFEQAIYIFFFGILQCLDMSASLYSKEENREGLGLMIVTMCTIVEMLIFNCTNKGNNRSACSAKIACKAYQISLEIGHHCSLVSPMRFFAPTRHYGERHDKSRFARTLLVRALGNPSAKDGP